MSNQNNEPVTETLTNPPIARQQRLETDFGQSTESAHDFIPFAPPLAPGELGRLGKYRIIRELGHGGMGAVYQAHDEQLDRDVALKIMLPKAAKNETSKARFLREARAAAKIDSDYVVAIYEAAEIDGIPYISQQLLKGYPLDEYFASKGGLSVTEIILIGRDIARGLAKAHELGLIHRDIKPGNIWYELPAERVKILDFGLAKSFTNDAVEVTSNGSILGTPAYMSVEQASGDKLDGRSDLFSLGAVLYRLSTGQLPFPGGQPVKVLKALVTTEPIPVLDLNPTIPADLATLIHRLLAKNPDERPETAQDVESELNQLLRACEPLEKTDPRTETSTNISSLVHPTVGQATAVNSFANNPIVDIQPRVKKNTYLRILFFLVSILIVAAGSYIIIKITHKDGTVTELKVDDQSKIEIDGKNMTPDLVNHERKLIYQYDDEPYLNKHYGTSIIERVIYEKVENGRWRGEVRILKASDKSSLIANQPLGTYREKYHTTNELYLQPDNPTMSPVKIDSNGLWLFRKASNFNNNVDWWEFIHKGKWIIPNPKLVQENSPKLINSAVFAAFSAYRRMVPPDYDPEYKWLAALPAEEQVKELSEELKRLNPGFDGKLERSIENNKVTSLKFFTMKVSNIAPLKAIKSLISLTMVGANAFDPGKLADISPLKGLKLEVLYIGSNPITDLSPLQGMPIKCLDLWACPYKDLTPLEGMPLTWLNLGGANQNPDLSMLKNLPLEFLCLNITQVSDLEPLNSLPLKTLYCSNTNVQSLKPLEKLKLQKLALTNTLVADLSPIKDSSLEFLECDGSKVTNLAPVKGMPLKTIRCNFNYQRDSQLLREIKTLEKINERPAADFWKAIELSQLPPVDGPAADRRAAEWVLAQGGVVDLNGIGEVKAVNNLPSNEFALETVNLRWRPFTDDELVLLKNLQSLKVLITQDSIITDAGLAHLQDIASLRELHLIGSKVTDVGMIYLKHLSNLGWLNLNGTKIGDAGLAHLKGLSSLGAIQMEGTPVTDDGLAHIKEFKNLDQLFLGSTRVSDKGLAHLKDCKKLKNLDLNHTKVTAEGVKTFAAAMPQCRIISDFGVFEPKIK